MPRKLTIPPPNYHTWRKLVLLRDNYTCQECGNKGFHSHHIKSYIDFPKIRLSVDNGITLCSLCHKNKHRKGWRNGKKVR